MEIAWNFALDGCSTICLINYITFTLAHIVAHCVTKVIIQAIVCGHFVD